VEIRSAELNDFAAVTELLEQLGRAAVTSQTQGAARAIYNRQVADPEAEHLVAVDDGGAIVGFCSLHFRPRLNHARPQAWIPDLIVEDRSRGAGAGRALLAEAERRARERGCWDLTLESGHRRREAHLLYTMAGMQDTGKMFRKSLDS